MEASFLAFVEDIDLEKLEFDAVHGIEFELGAAELDVKIGDHAAKIDGM